MSSPKLFADESAPLVADASAVINLNGTDRAAEILAAIPHPVLITDQAVAELEDGRKHGYCDADKLAQLLEERIVMQVSLGEVGEKIYERLVSGPAILTLDDGEAATIACAIEQSGIALIDERKAYNLCAVSHPSLELVSTTAILLDERVTGALGAQDQSDAIFAALRTARMRVPNEFLKAVSELLGPDRTAQCVSLPKSARASK